MTATQAETVAVIAAMDGPDGALQAMGGTSQENGNRTDDPNGLRRAAWVQMSTIGEAAARRCAEAAKEHGDFDFSATYLTITPTGH